MRWSSWVLIIQVIFCSLTVHSSEIEFKTAREITQEALMKPSDNKGKPLPLVASWNMGFYENTYNPSFQMQLISEGHHVLPWFALDTPGQKSKIKVANYYDPIVKVKELGLPITFLSTQWERILTDDEKYLKLNPAENPNVVNNNGEILKELSPLSKVEYWLEVGKTWGESDVLKKMQEIYQNPPLILFVSNNEHKKLEWMRAYEDKRFSEQYGSNLSVEKINGIFLDSWVLRYKALQDGFRNGMANQIWKNNAKFVGYNAFGTEVIGRWAGWKKYEITTEKHSSAWPLAWDGASPPFYTHDWDPSTDYNVWGPMIGAMNWVYMQEEVFQNKPDFWFELSVWDGNQPGRDTDKRKYYELTGNPYSPLRYGGMVKYAMWLLRPRVVREFRNPDQTVKGTGEYFMQIVNAVDRVYSDPNLTKFWRYGKLVKNPTHQHPYQENISSKVREKDRWYLLNTSYDAKWPWNVHTNIPVFAIALELVNGAEKEWLLYCFSPFGVLENVMIEIPGYKTVEVTSSSEGLYYLLKSKDQKITKL